MLSTTPRECAATPHLRRRVLFAAPLLIQEGLHISAGVVTGIKAPEWLHAATPRCGYHRTQHVYHAPA